MKLTISILVTSLVFAACASQPLPPKPHDRLHAVLYQQHSAEYRAVCLQVFQSAVEHLAAALQDPQWSAETSQTGDLRSLPPAVILDIDETVLDNSPYFGQMILGDEDFDLKQWNRWVVSARAELIPGAKEFIMAAQAAGITVFLVTNRDARLEGYTRLNLQRLGITLDPNLDTVLSLNERPDWTADKQSRRSFIARTHRILLLIGDDLGDFVSVSGMEKETRKQLIVKHASFWGTRWFALPNANYGSWLDVIVKGARDKEDLLARKRAAIIAAPLVSEEEMRALMTQPVPPFPHQQEGEIILVPSKPKESSTPPEETKDPRSVPPSEERQPSQ